MVGGGRALQGSVRVPGDKSIAHRALILNALARGQATVRGMPGGADVASTVRVLRLLGVRVDARGPDAVVVHGRSLCLDEPKEPLDCGNSGTTLRLVLGLLAGQPISAVLAGDASLNRRPTDRVVAPLARMGARFDGPCRTPPVRITGVHGLEACAHDVPVASAQVKSALLLAGMQARGTTTVTQPLPTRDHTELLMRAMGLPVRGGVGGVAGRVAVEGGSMPQAVDVDVPGDVSSAAFLVVAALLAPGSALEIRDVGLNPTRLGLLTALERMGARIEVEASLAGGGEPRGHLRVECSPLRAARVLGPDVPGIIDELPILAVAATQAEGTTVIEGAHELRVKESDRIAGTTRLLRALGARVEERPDGMVIEGGRPLTGARVASDGDHRLAMAAAVAATVARGETVIEDSACVAVSFPDFFALLEGLRRS